MPRYALLIARECSTVKVILIENNESDRSPSIWAEAINQFFSLRGCHCVYYPPDATSEDEARGLLDSAMDSSGVVIVETHGGATPSHDLIPDYTITIRSNKDWRMDIGRAALCARLEAWLDKVDQIDNERIVVDCLKVALDAWSDEEQQRLSDALVSLGWRAQQNANGKLEWRRKDATPDRA